MAILHITEFKNLRLDDRGNVTSFPKQPGTDSKDTYTTNVASAAFATTTKFIRVIADADAYYAFGLAPVATANSPFLSADRSEIFGVEAGHKIAAYDGSS